MVEAPETFKYAFRQSTRRCKEIGMKIRVHLLTLVSLATLAIPVAGVPWAAQGVGEARNLGMPGWPGPSSLQTADPCDSVRYDMRIHDVSNIGMTVTNFGLFGNNFVNRNPSLEYPLGSTIDHLIIAGLWIGAINSDGDTLVTTATYDAYWNTPSRIGGEFAPATCGIEEISASPSSEYYSPGAYSEQDFIAFYSDLFFPGTVPTGHFPLGVLVKQRSMVWNCDSDDDFVLVDLTLRNISSRTLGAMYLGMYSELASGNKSAYPNWPPTGWFSKKDIAYYDSLRMVSGHHYTFDGGRAPSWAAIKLLGLKVNGVAVDPSAKRISFNWWSWDPGATDKNTDPKRYLLMSNGEIDPTAGSEAPQYDAVELLSIGPIDFMEASDSVSIAFAFMGGDDEQDLIANANRAQKEYDSGYEPPSSGMSFVSVSGKGVDGRAVLSWQMSMDAPISKFVIERSESPDGQYERLELPISESADHTFSCSDSSVRQGKTYWYNIVLRGSCDVGSYGPVEVSVGVVRAAYAAYQSYPNPFKPHCTIRYEIAWPGKVSLRVYDLNGSLVRTLVNAWRESGVYNEVWDGRGDSGKLLASGVYLYRLETGDVLEAGHFVATRKMVLLR